MGILRLQPKDITQVSTVVDLLRFRASRQPEKVAYTYLADGEFEEARLTYAELEGKARSIAITLGAHARPGDRALLLYPPGLDFIAGFMGCLYAGVIAVPAYPPRPNRDSQRLHAILDDSQSSIALTSTALLPRARALVEESPRWEHLRVVITDDIDAGPADGWVPPAANGDTVAFLQYTSGSTAKPKGVMVSHANLIHNERLIQRALGQGEDSIIVGWLPLYHDMGLIGNVLQTLYVGAKCVLMAPAAFLQRPLRWLKAISRFRATTSGGPNFAYDLCAQKITGPDRMALDLSDWKAAFNGAEPVRSHTLERFASTFEPCGFKREAFRPCYGLAEATLFVCGGGDVTEPIIHNYQAEGLSRGEVVESRSGDEKARDLVSCGRESEGQRVLIVDPESLAPSAPDRVGEIWVSGPSVAKGYWGREEETQSVFKAHLADTGEGPFLRTGDLGFIRNGAVFITGRSKDLIIIRGQNHYPQDIELTVERSHPSLRPGCGAAFSVDVEGEERLIVVYEVGRAQDLDPGAIAGNIRQSVARELELQVYGIVLIKAGSIPKTSSGKIQRHACRAIYLEGGLDVILEQAGDPAQGISTPPLQSTAFESEEAIEEWLITQLSSKLRIGASQIDIHQPINRYGLDSLMAVEMAHVLESTSGVALPFTDFLGDSSVSQLAALLFERLKAASPVASPLARSGEETDLHPLTHGQKAIFFLHQLEPASSAYNIARAVRLRSAISKQALEQSFQSLLARHPLLRSTFHTVDGEPVLRTHEKVDAPLTEENAATWSEAFLKDRLNAEAQRPFDLERRPLIRLNLYARARDEYVFLMVVHHIVVDFWSLAVLLSELETLYAKLKRSGEILAPLPVDNSSLEYARWQNEMLAGPDGERLWNYWRERLAGPLPVLNLPTDKPRPPVQTYRGRVRSIRIGADLTRSLRAFSRSNEVTLFVTLLTAFQTLLHSYTGQDDIVIGCPTSCRSRAEMAKSVGYFVNPAPIRTSLSGDPPFKELLGRTHRTVISALEHQDFPFPLLVERLQPARDPGRSPIFQAMFVMQKPPLLDAAGLSSLAMNELGARIDLGELAMESLSLDDQTAQFDLTMTAAEARGELAVSLQYNADLFHAATIERMLACYCSLLEAVASSPETAISELPVMSYEERRQALVEWNATEKDYGRPRCLHDLIRIQTEATPDAVAVCYEDRLLTYGELNRRSNQLAWRLRSSGVGPDVTVGICVERSLEMIVGLLGVLKAGGAYLPLDPSYPKERLAFMIEDARPQALLTQHRFLNDLPDAPGARVIYLEEWLEEALGAAHGFEDLPIDVAPDNLVYTIYTSGSTGKPKGAANTHGAICNRLLWMQNQFRLTAADRVAQKTPFSFDVSVWELFWPLLAGACLVIAKPDGHRDAAYLGSLIEGEGVTTLHFVPSMLRAFLEDPGVESCESLRRVICSGEALPFNLQERFFARFDTELHNLYGPTEAAVDVTSWKCERRGDRQSVPIGRPISNTRLYIADKNMNPVPVGATGEIYIGGAGLARGYLRRPDLTAEKFVPNPSSGEAGERLYRTGDLARYLPDGNIEFLGRMDHQVKIRGFRIELGEVEAALTQHPGVRDALALVHDSSSVRQKALRYRVADQDRLSEAKDFRFFLKGGVSKTDEDAEGKRIVAYIVCDPETRPAAGALRRFMKKQVPDYMIPSHFVTLDAFPLTPNGKVDRRALPKPDMTRPDLENEYVAPTTPVEAGLAKIWAEALKLDRVGIHDNFFELGGDSIRSLQVRARAQEQGYRFSLQQMLQYQTLSELARVIETEAPPPALTARTAPLSLLREEDRERLPAGVEDAYPLARVQAGLIYHCQLNPHPAMYHDVFIYRLQAQLDFSLFRKAVQQVVDRHPILRTSFDLVNFSEPLQLVHREVTASVELVDWRDLAPNRQRQEQAAWLEAERNQPIDLSRPTPIRFFIHRLSDESFDVVLSFHDTILDGWSTAPMLTELLHRYSSALKGEPRPLQPLPAVTFRDFVAMETATIESEEARQFWREKLSDCAITKLPEWAGSAPEDEGARIVALPVEISPATSEGLQRLALIASAPLKHVLLAAHVRVMSLLSGQPDVITGLESNGRLEEVDGDQTLGVHINTVPFHIRLSGGTWVDLTRQALEVERELLPFRRYPLFEIQKGVGQRSLVETVFNYTHFHIFNNLHDLNLEVRGARGFEQTSFPFRAEFNLNPFSNFLQLDLTCDLTRIPQERLERIGHYYSSALAEMARTPYGRYEEASLLSAEEKRQILCSWNETTSDFPLERHFSELFEEQVSRAPDAIAVVSGDERLSYRELHDRVERLAGILVEQGVGPEKIVALIAHRGIHLLTSILAVFRAGGAYLPLDPTYPAARLAQILDQSDCDLIITTSDMEDHLRQSLSGLRRNTKLGMFLTEKTSRYDDSPPHPVRGTPNNIAYVIYTSGSTGIPKGAMVEHTGMLNHLFVKIEGLRLTEQDAVAQTASQCFDISVWQFLAALLVGGRVDIVDDEMARHPRALLDEIEREGISIVEVVPSMLRATLDEMEISGDPPPDLSSLRWLIATGEALPPDLCRRWLKRFPRIPMLNAYGPTECSDDVTHYAFESPPASEAARMPIGRAVQNMRMYALHRWLAPAPDGVAGELYVGGVGVGRGYLNDVVRTAGAFLPDPFGQEPGGRLYKTGDLARYLPDGNIEYLGRIDQQVKVRGYRIELGEIEAVLCSHPAVRAAVAQMVENERGVKRLVGYVVPDRNVTLEPAGLREFMSERLPDYMVPTVFMMLKSLPLTPNGKLDLRNLPKPGDERPGAEKLARILQSLEQLSEAEVETILSSKKVE